MAESEGHWGSLVEIFPVGKAKEKGFAYAGPHFLMLVVGTTGFEPATPASRMQTRP
jgi:hypothetical protein